MDSRQVEVDPEKIVQFCEITGADPEQARTMLAINDGNVEAAVVLFMESGGVENWTAATTGRADMDTGGDGGHSSNSTRPPEDVIRAPMAPMRDTLIGGHDDFVSHFPRAANPSHRANVFESEDDSEDSNQLANLFAPPRNLMFDGTLDQAREFAQHEQKWIIISLHDPTVFACQALNRDLWKDSSIEQIIRASFVFMQPVVETPHGEQYRNFYPVESLPHISILDPRTGERVKIWQHKVETTEFMLEIMDFLETHSLTSTQSTAKKRAVIDLTEDEQIAAAVSESLKDEGEGKQNATSDIQALERAEVKPGTQGSTSIQFRMPDGKRIVRKFLKSDPIRVLFEHVKHAVTELQSRPFELLFHREALSRSLEKSLEDLNISAAAINVDYSE